MKDIKRYREPINWDENVVSKNTPPSVTTSNDSHVESEITTEPPSGLTSNENNVDKKNTALIAPVDAIDSVTVLPPSEGERKDSSGVRRSGRTRKPPVWYSLMAMMTCLCVTTIAAPQESFLTEGVIFKHTASVGFSDSEWVIVIDVSMKPVSDAIDRVQRWMTRGVEELMSATQGLDTINTRLLSSTKTRTAQRNQVIHSMKERLQLLNDAIYSPARRDRQKRGIINAGGEILHLLFGTATDSSLNELSKKMEILGKGQTGIVHTLEEQASLINGTLWSIQTHSELIKQLNGAHEKLRQEVSNLVQRSARDLKDIVSALCRFEELYGTTDRILNEIQQAIDDWAVSLATLANGRLPPELLSPTRLFHLLRDIRDRLPAGWALTPVLRGADIWRAYQEAVVVTAARQDNLRLFVHLPVYEIGHSFELYELITLPVYADRLQSAVVFKDLPRFLAVSGDHQTFIELESRDVEKCKGFTDMICPLRKAISRKNLRSSCAAALFLYRVDRVRSDCIRVPTAWKGSEAIHLENRRWAYSTNYTQLIDYQCEDEEISPRSVSINGTGFIDVPRGCSAHTDEWIFQASFRREISTTAETTRNWTVRELPPIEFSHDMAVNDSIDDGSDKRAHLIQELLRRNQQSVGSVRSLQKDIQRLREFDDKRILLDASQLPSTTGQWVVIGFLIVALIALICGAFYGNKNSSLSVARIDAKVRVCSEIQSKLTLELNELRQRMGAHEAAAGTTERRKK